MVVEVASGAHMKPTLADRINAAIAANDTKTGLIPMGQGPINTPARTYLSPTDAYENQIGPSPETLGFAPGVNRGMWSLAEQQNASVPVTALRVGNSKTTFLAAVQGGLVQNPQAPATTWSTVPQMITSLNVKGPIVITANVTVQSSAANDTAGFALYRDGQLIGNSIRHTLPATASASCVVSLTQPDTPPFGPHLYALYWSPGTGTLIATSNYRNLAAVNLSPQ